MTCCLDRRPEKSPLECLRSCALSHHGRSGGRRSHDGGWIRASPFMVEANPKFCGANEQSRCTILSYHWAAQKYPIPPCLQSWWSGSDNSFHKTATSISLMSFLLPNSQYGMSPSLLAQGISRLLMGSFDNQL